LNEIHARRQKGRAQVLHDDIHNLDPPPPCWVRQLNFSNIKVEEPTKSTTQK